MLKNYTSSVPANRSIALIEAKLAQKGASQVLKYYDDQQRTKCICFILKIDGKEIAFKLPCRVDACERVLLSMTTARTKNETLKKIPQQAERTAWKILYDWVDAQMAMIELAQIEVLEVFLPYVYDNQTGKTYFEAIKEKGLKMLPGN